jgi:DNA-binding response OmpR family regulator
VTERQVVLVADDDPLIQRLVRTHLYRAGFRVVTAADGEAALDMAAAEQPDLIVLDLMLPDVDGFEVCKRVREFSLVPIVMLTARGDQVDKLRGFEVGADDYLTKPFSMHELLARVKAQLRRAAMQVASVGGVATVLTAGDLTVDVGAHRVLRNGEALQLKRREFDLLVYLMRHPGQLQSRETLLRNVWGYEYSGDTRTVDVHVRWLRGKIEDDPAAPTRIQTVRGVGYVFTE